MAVTNKTFADLITFTRSGAATRVNSAGLIESVAADTPRFDYDPVTLEEKGLLIEEGRTNLLLRSEEFNTTWANTRSTDTADAIAAPDGATTADKLVEDATASNTHVIGQGASVTTGNDYTFSVFVKAAERNWIALQVSAANFGGGASPTAYFDVSSGSTGSTTGPVTTAVIQNYGDGWFRCSITAACTSTGSAGHNIYLADSDGGAVYTGDGTSGVYIWGAQQEVGAFASSYIPTTSATVTRNADNASITGTNFSDWFNASEGTVYCEFGSLDDSGLGRALSLNDGTTGERMEIRPLSSSQFLVSDGAATQASISAGTPALDGSFVKLACAFKVDDFAVSLDGGIAATDTSGTLPTVDRLVIGNSAGGSNFLNGHIKDIRFYPSRLSNAELQALTA